MDPLTSLSIAAAVLQIIQFGSQIVSKGYQIHRSAEGTLSANVDIEVATRNLRRTTTKLNSSLQEADFPLTEESQILQNISSHCTRIADVLITRLDELKIQGDGSRSWKSFRQAIKSIVGKNGVEELAKSLSLARSQLEIHILATLREQQSLLLIQQDDRFNTLDKATQFIITAMSEFRSKFETDFDDHVSEMKKLVHQDRNGDPMSRSHKTLVDTITEICNNANAFGSIKRYERDPEQVSITEIEYSAEVSASRCLSATRLGDYTVQQLAEEGVLKSLKFAIMEERYDEISEAHHNTFQWIFREPEGRRQWHSFTTWLTADAGIYWINGKAASGKSTLMKFVCENQQTSEALFKWAAGTSLHTASFFFWNSGTTEQRSHKGLLKTLLHQVLSHQPELIPHVLPQKWSKRLQALSNSTPPVRTPASVPFDEIWTLPKLKAAFKLLCSQTVVQVKLCFFIDGLDEYDGDCMEMSQLFLEISQQPNVKVCVSSRPWLVFEEAFEDVPTLRVQDLTRPDIVRFTEDKLRCNNRWRMILKQNPISAPKLVGEIVDKSSGVFPWVKLVVNSLLNGLQNHDSISDLKKRLYLLPIDLKKLYMHMLETIQPHFYLEEASRLFQIVRQAREEREFISCNQLSEPSPLTVVELALARDYDQEYDTNQQAGDTPRGPERDMLLRSQHMSCMLKTRCAGLLELGPGAAMDDEPQTSFSTPGKDCCSPLQPVVYLHRTARDFLEEADNWKTITQHNLNSDFNARTSLLQSCVRFLAVVEKLEIPLECLSYLSDHSGRPPQSDRKWSAVFQAFLYAYRIECDTGDPQEALLDELDEIVESQHTACRSAKEHWTAHSPLTVRLRHCGWKDSFLSNAIQHGLYSYVQCKLAKDPDLVKRKAGVPLLDYAIYPFPSNIEYTTRSKIIHLLLEYDASPNTEFKGTTAWHLALYQAKQERAPGTPDRDSWLAILTDLAMYGAKFQGEVGELSRDSPSEVERLFEKSDPVAVSNLLHLLENNLAQPIQNPDVEIPEVGQNIRVLQELQIC